MKRTRPAAEPVATRPRAGAPARSAKATPGTQARERAQRTAAVLRLQACANVFAHSRICFDARAARGGATAVDCTPDAGIAAASDDADPAAPESFAPGEEITIH